jgi:hypothetical protein
MSKDNFSCLSPSHHHHIKILASFISLSLEERNEKICFSDKNQVKCHFLSITKDWVFTFEFGASELTQEGRHLFPSPQRPAQNE